MVENSDAREVEIEWLAAELSRSIANLGYAVGCGLAPHPDHTRRAAEELFDRYARIKSMPDEAMIRADLIADGRAQGLEEAAEILHAHARSLICGKRRTNQVDRHTAEVLCRARDEIRARTVPLRRDR